MWTRTIAGAGEAGAHRGNASIPDRVAALAVEAPQATALRAACGELSYTALDEKAARLAAVLRAKGVAAESLVAILLPRSFDGIVAQLAVWKAGGAWLPLDPAWPDARLKDLIGRSGAVLAISNDALSTRIGGDVPLLSMDAAANADPLPPETAPGDRLAYVIYTSGSTGEPKGVEITHANLANLVDWHNDAFGVTAADRGSHLAGLGFDAAVWEVWPYLACSASLSLAPEAVRTSPEALRDWIVAEQVTVAFAPTALAEPMAAMGWPADSRLRVLLTGADRLTRRPAPGQPFAFVNNYGPTECTVVATSSTVPSEGEGLPPIGHGIANTIIRLLDADRRPVADGEIGELWIGGASVGRGYRGDPALTAERFVTIGGERLYRTGDLAARLPDGQIAFHGRADAQEKIRGHRLEPDEIAAALQRHTSVRACAVAARAVDGGEKMLVAWIVPEGAAPGAAEMRDFAAAELPDYMVPAVFVRVDVLPLNANGKLDRAALPAPTAENRLAEAASRAPESPTEIRLAEIVGAVLGRNDIGADDNFFLLGGHSLLGTQVVLRARDAFGIEVTLLDLFEAQTVAKLAAKIEELIIEKLANMSDDDINLWAAE